MQSTNSEYGSPYLAVCHVTFTFILCKCCVLMENKHNKQSSEKIIFYNVFIKSPEYKE